MRRALLALPLVLLAACGSSDAAPPPLYGGFTPTGGTAIVFPPTTCDIPFVGLTSISGLGVVLGDFTGVCEYVTASQFCDQKASATLLVSLAVGGVVGGGTAAPIGPGAYPYLSAPPTSASFAAGIASAVQTSATCTALPGTSTDMNAGRIVISSITADRATGALELRFDDGSGYSEHFDLALCPPPTDLCALVSVGSCFDPGCLP